MQRESLHCGELIKRLNDILGRCANEELRADDMTSSQVKTVSYTHLDVYKRQEILLHKHNHILYIHTS